MQLAIVTIICFLILLSISSVVVFALRGRLAPATAPEASLRRDRNVYDQSAATTVTDRLDQAFDRLVLESGLGLNSLTAMLLALVFALLVGGVTFLASDNPLLGAFGGLAGLLLPIAYFAFKRSRRFRLMEDQLPDAIDTMARAVHAGESLEEAIQLVSSETNDPLRGEFRWCQRQLELGLPVSTVMRGLSRRIHLISVRTLGSTLAVHRQTGGNLATTLERLAAVVRSRQAFRRQMRASTGAGRLSAQLIAAAGPLLFVVLFFLHPDHIRRLLIDSPGRMMLAIGIILEIVGIIWLSQLMRRVET